MTVTVLAGDAIARLRELPADSIHAVVTDPPYHLTSIVKRFGSANAAPAKSNGATGVYGRASAGFMGQQWDGGDIAFRPEMWAEVARAMLPGAHLAAFGGTRTYHRMACAIEDAGFEIRDQIGWLHGSGFAKNGYLSYKIEATLCERRGARLFYVGTDEEMRRAPPFRHSDADEVWGWAGALKPAWEPIVLARKPLSEDTVAANVLRHGTGALNVDACRVATDESTIRPINTDVGMLGSKAQRESGYRPNYHKQNEVIDGGSSAGRWPANVAHDGSPEVMDAFAGFGESNSVGGYRGAGERKNGWGMAEDENKTPVGFGDTGTAARFFFCGKADRDERCGSKHPTVKPVALMEWLVRLITPTGGTVLDPFCGTGSTLVACDRLGLDAVGIERDEQYVRDAHEKIRRFRARRAIGNVERAPVLPGQLGLF